MKTGLHVFYDSFTPASLYHTFCPGTVWISKLFSVSFTISISISVTQIVRPCLNINIAVTVLFNIIIHIEHNTFVSHRFAYIMSNSFTQTEDYRQTVVLRGNFSYPNCNDWKKSLTILPQSCATQWVAGNLGQT